jgi:hypothetical protein
VLADIESIQLPHYRELWEETRRLLENIEGYIPRSEYMKTCAACTRMSNHR